MRRAGLPYVVAGAIVAGAALGAAAVALTGWRGGVRYTDIPSAELPLPGPDAGGPAAGVRAPASPGGPPQGAVTPAEGSAEPVVVPAGELKPLRARELAEDPPTPPPGRAAPAMPPAPAAPRSAPAQPGVAAAGSPTVEGRGGPPLDADPALLERRGAVDLPVRAPDGRAAVRAYARPVAPGGEGRPQIAVVVTGLGLARESSEAALALPPDVTLAVSPHADGPGAWLRGVRAAGHEAMLTLPLEPADPARIDPGPEALRVVQPAAERESSLLWLLGRGTGYTGLAAEAGAFAARPDAFAPVAEALARRGLGLVELGGTRLAGVAATRGLAYVGTQPRLDATPAAARIDQALGRLEEAALEDGAAVGWASGYPVTLARLASWAETLPGKGLRLVPLGALMAEGGRVATPEIAGQPSPPPAQQ